MRPHPTLRLTPVAIATVLFAACGSLGASTPPGQDYHVFVGLNLSIRAEDKHLPVQSVTGGYIHVMENGRVRTVPYYDALAYRMDTDVKVSDLAVRLDNLKAERAYTPAADPQRKWNNAMMDNYVNQSLAKAHAEQKVIQTALALAMQGTSTQGTPPNEGELTAALGAMDSAMTSIPGGDSGFFQQRMHDELHEEMFDAIEMEFSISSPVELPDPYFVATAEFQDENKPGVLYHWIYAQELDEVTPTPKKVRVFKGGFPPGFKLQKYRVNVFSGRRELATNLSEKHMVLNQEDAHLYLRTQYESGNRGKDLTPRPLWTNLPAEMRSQIPPTEFRRVLLVEVDDQGRAIDVTPEDNEYGRLDPRVVEAVKSFRYYPALEKGKPVSGRLRMQFSEMTRRRAQAD